MVYVLIKNSADKRSEDFEPTSDPRITQKTYGIGLAMVKALVGKFGGDIKALPSQIKGLS
ncbi:MAG: signal transduction histidine kinase [Marinoscillum sp.]|jgi:signal transduction histidine kinase